MPLRILNEEASLDLIKIDNCVDIVCYPKHKASNVECKNRIKHLMTHGINHIISYGRISIGRVNVLGKGFSSIIALTSYNNTLSILKIRRFDSRRDSLMHECKLITKASLYGITPYVYLCSGDFILMEYIHGLHLGEFIKKSDISDIRRVVVELLIKAFILDRLDIDHGELSRPWKHVLISNKGVYIIDFESASMSRKPHNVTCLVNALFVNPHSLLLYIVSLERHDVMRIRENIIEVLSKYKKNMDFNSFEKLIQLIQKLLV